MQRRRIKASSIGLLFLGVAIFFDVLPWPGLGAGLIQTMFQAALQETVISEDVGKTPQLERLEVSTQNNFSSGARNDG